MSENTRAKNAPEEEFYSVQEISKKLEIPENTLRKYLTYFQLPVKRIGRKNFLSSDIVKYLKEILQLKSNSWSLKQIKSFRDAQKNQKSEKNESIEEAETTETEEAPQEIKKEASSPATQNENLQVDFSQVDNNNEQAESAKQAIETTNQAEPEFAVEPETVNDGMAETKGNSPDKPEQIKETQPPSNPKRNNNYQTGQLDRDQVNKLIGIEAKKISRLYRFLSSRASSRDLAEAQSTLDLRVKFLAGLRHLRDNWLSKQKQPANNHHNQQDAQTLEAQLVGNEA
jgi:DNA-binding transcriptional MerR regulator